MKKHITYAIIAFFATTILAIAAPEKDVLMEKEKAAWQAFKDKKPDDFKKVVSTNFMGVYVEGMSDMQKEMDDMKKWDMKSFEISDYKVVSDGPNIAVSTYTVKIEGTYDGKDQSGTYNAGSVWHKRARGEWQAIFHTNAKQEAATNPAG